MAFERGNKVVDKVNNIAQKLASEIHLRAIRDAFLTTIPFLMLGGIMVFINYVLLTSGFITNWLSAETIANISIVGNKIITATNNLLAVIMTVLISYNLAKMRKSSNLIIPTITSLTVLIIFMPSVVNLTPLGAEEAVQVSGVIPTSLTGTNGMLVAIIVGLVATEIYLKLSSHEKLKLKITGNVPPAIIESFNSLFVIMLVLIGAAAIAALIYIFTGYEIHELINETLQKPLVGVITTLPAFLLYFGPGQCLCYFFGIHPSGVINPIFEPGLMVALEENTAAYIAGEAIPNIISLPFRDVYGTLGGIGSTFGLIIAILLISKKRKDLRAVAKLSVPTSLFNINEPMLFGIPIVFNPILLIPFIFTTTICYTLAYAATALGLVSRLCVYTSWSTPVILSGYVASGGDIRNSILQIILIAITIICYLPFVKIMEKQEMEME